MNIVFIWDIIYNLYTECFKNMCPFSESNSEDQNKEKNSCKHTSEKASSQSVGNFFFSRKRMISFEI